DLQAGGGGGVGVQVGAVRLGHRAGDLAAVELLGQLVQRGADAGGGVGLRGVHRLVDDPVQLVPVVPVRTGREDEVGAVGHADRDHALLPALEVVLVL